MSRLHKSLIIVSVTMFGFFVLVGTTAGAAADNRVRTDRESYDEIDDREALFEHVISSANRTSNRSDDVETTTLASNPLPSSGRTADSATLDIISPNGTDMAEIGRAKKGGKHDKVKKKKKKIISAGMSIVLQLLWHQVQKWIPDFTKLKGPGMFMLGMMQANFNNFVMHALMMSKMALVSVIMMIIREFVFGDKDHPVRYYNFGYEHPHPYYHHHHYRTYTYQEPSVSPTSDDYQYDYKRRRKRQTSSE